MKFIINIIFLLFFISAYCQEKDFYVVDNSYYKIFKNKKVKQLKNYKTDLLDGGIESRYLEIVRDFDIYGNIIKEREYYDNDTINDIEIKHIYNEKHKLIKTEWLWLDDKTIEVTEYEYNKDGKLKKSCDYLKNLNSDIVRLQNCDKYIYRKDLIKKVKSYEKNKTKFYYKKNDSLVIKYSDKKELVSKYFNGDIVYLKNNSEITKYTRNHKGQVFKIEIINNENKIITTFLFEYKDELLIKVIKKNSAGFTIEFDDIHYEFHQ